MRTVPGTGNKMFASVKLPFWATVFTLIGVGILLMLGFWQLDRLVWKSELLEKIESSYARDASQNPLDLSSKVLERGFVRGVYEHDKSFKIAPRTYKGTPGYHVLTPFLTRDGAYILVNRGWVPFGFSGEIVSPTEEIRLVGSIRKPQEPNMFTPDNNPDEDVWYYVDLKEIAVVKGLKDLWSLMIYVESTSESYPLAVATKPRLKNNHMQYVIFWFSMAGVLVLIYALRFLRR